VEHFQLLRHQERDDNSKEEMSGLVSMKELRSLISVPATRT